MGRTFPSKRISWTSSASAHRRFARHSGFSRPRVWSACKRGNVGGAVVLQPKVEKVAYMLALVMQASSVSLGDVSHALVQLEIPCAAECARRPDRDRTVVPRLRAVLDESRAVIDVPRRLHGLGASVSTRKWSTAAATRP